MLSGTPLATGLVWGLLSYQDAVTLPLSLLLGGLGSLVTLTIGVLRGDERHDTGLHRIRISDVSVLLVYAVIVVVTYTASASASRSVSGEVYPAVSNPAYLTAGALATVCFVLSCHAFDTGRTRACVLWTVPMPPLGLLFCWALEPGPGTALAGLFAGALCAMVTLLMGLFPGPDGQGSSFRNLRRAHVLAFLGHLGLIILIGLCAVVWVSLGG